MVMGQVQESTPPRRLRGIVRCEQRYQHRAVELSGRRSPSRPLYKLMVNSCQDAGACDLTL